MSDVELLRPAHGTGLVEMLTALLVRAKAGEIDQVALVFTMPGGPNYGTWISDRAPGGSTLMLIGAIADLQWSLLQLHNDSQENRR